MSALARRTVRRRVELQRRPVQPQQTLRPECPYACRRVRRRRVGGWLRLCVFLLLVFGAAWAGVRVAQASTDAGVFPRQEYVVRAGDTLWEVAASEYGHELDLRRAVHEIRVANGLGAAAIQPGQRLTLPCLGE